MMPSEKEGLSKFLTNVASALDIPDYIYEDVILKYEDVGNWLSAEDSQIEAYAPEIYPQGSFRLGTIVRPVSNADEYDIDLVCHLQLEKENTTQADLRQMIGNRLKKRDDLASMLEPLDRCWRLSYPAKNGWPHFHMDVLPAIPNWERPPTGILLSDRDLTRWQKSNPKAYAEWFYGRMRHVFLQKKASLAESMKSDIKDVPEWKVKTPLQIAIQILKRHRDIYFQSALDDKPASIILTTLAAFAYKGHSDVFDALENLVGSMTAGIEQRQGRWWISNPTDPDENFADKWNEHPERKRKFDLWMEKVRTDFHAAFRQPSLQKGMDIMENALDRGARTTTTRDAFKALRSLPTTLPDLQVPVLGDFRHCQPPQWPVSLIYKAAVTGSVHLMKTFKEVWGLTNRPVPKDMRLKFKVRTNTPAPFEVNWQVVNTGKEAFEAGQLRGDFYQSDGAAIGERWETTLYKGTHWIEAFIIKNGRCVARSGRTMVRVR